MSLRPGFPHHNTAMDRHLAKRWCLLAETRLAYLTDLFETGRWRRFHSEIEFLENIQEAKDAVDRWRAMAAGEPVEAPRSHGVIYQAPRAADAKPQGQSRPAHMASDAATDAPLLIPIEKLLRQAPPRDFAKRTAPLPEMSITPADLDWRTALDQTSIGERYPMLRTAM